MNKLKDYFDSKILQEYYDGKLTPKEAFIQIHSYIPQVVDQELFSYVKDSSEPLLQLIYDYIMVKPTPMTTVEFLDWYDNDYPFSEDQLRNLYWGEFIDDENVKEVDSFTGEHHRWTHEESKVYKIQNRYFEFYARIANTEYQDDEFDIEPTEVKPVEKVVICWEAIE